MALQTSTELKLQIAYLSTNYSNRDAMMFASGTTSISKESVTSAVRLCKEHLAICP